MTLEDSLQRRGELFLKVFGFTREYLRGKVIDDKLDSSVSRLINVVQCDDVFSIPILVLYTEQV